VGNADNAEMRNISGITGAAPIWNEFMRFALANEPVVDFTPPAGVKQFEVCADTGALPSPACPERRLLWFAEERPPLPAEKDLYQIVRLDKSNGKLATEFTPAEMIEEKVFKIYPEPYRQWAEEHGIAQPPADPSDVFGFAPEVQIRSPIEGEVVEDVITVYGSANAPAFASYELQYGISHDPGAFSPPISGPFGNPVIDRELGQWDTRGLQEGPHTLRLVVRDTFGNEYDQRVRLFVRLPPPTPEASNTPTWTPEALATPSETPTLVLLPTEIPAVTETPTHTPQPTQTETPTTFPTETPVVVTDTPTWTPEPSPTDTPTVDVSAPITSSAIITGMELITATTGITEP
jgi:membrane peptidoglycan carboxypeptidase